MSAPESVRQAAERIMWQQMDNTDDAVEVAEFVMADPVKVESGGIGFDSDGRVFITLDGERREVAKSVALAIARGVMSRATITLT